MISPQELPHRYRAKSGRTWIVTLVCVVFVVSGFFVGRKEVVDWINDTLKLNFVKVEQTASGALLFPYVSCKC